VKQVNVAIFVREGRTTYFNLEEEVARSYLRNNRGKLEREEDLGGYGRFLRVEHGVLVDEFTGVFVNEQDMSLHYMSKVK